MSRLRIAGPLLTLLTYATACTPDQLRPAALVAYATDPSHGLLQADSSGHVTVTALYEPASLLQARDYLTEQGSQPKADYTASHYLLVGLDRRGQELLRTTNSFAEYSNLLQQLSFQLQEHAVLTNLHGDTVRSSTYQVDPTYKMADRTYILFVFPRIAYAPELTLHLTEFGLGTGSFSFTFSAQAIDNAPTMAL